jgi:dUTP pyrophosphatase
LKLKVLNLSGKASYLPKYQSPGAVGFDLCAAIDRAIELGPGNRQQIPTGLAFEIPEGFELQVRGRSGLASRHGVNVVLGTIDSDFRGEVQVIINHSGKVPYVISPGDRIAQAVLSPVVKGEFEVVKELTKTERGKAGFGSTGVR